MHPFTSLTLWALAACTTLILPAQTILPIYSAATFLPYCAKALRGGGQNISRLADVLAGAGLAGEDGGWLPEWLGGIVLRSPERWSAAITLCCGFYDCFNLTVVDAVRLVQCFIRALFASACRQASLQFAGPLLVAEQLKRQLAIIHEAQRARSVPLDEGWYQRLRAMPALIIPLTHNALNDLAVRSAAR